MKKFLSTYILILLISVSITQIAPAAEYMAGIRTGYFAWQPFLKDISASGMNDIKWGTGILYGPIFSIMLTDDFSISVSTLFGNSQHTGSQNSAILTQQPG
ncbi:MAG: hypothetical protein N3F66_14235 [Spirochaetes bacterium]|nr:hypothetical protein [Spirochaetota bacterium]